MVVPMGTRLQPAPAATAEAAAVSGAGSIRQTIHQTTGAAPPALATLVRPAIAVVLAGGALCVLLLGAVRFARFRRLLAHAERRARRDPGASRRDRRRAGPAARASGARGGRGDPAHAVAGAGRPGAAAAARAARRADSATNATRSWPTSWRTCTDATTGCACWSFWRRRSSGGTRSPGGRAPRCGAPRSAAATSGCCACCRDRPRRTRTGCSRASASSRPPRRPSRRSPREPRRSTSSKPVSRRS